jgi:hypothetical protein
MSHTQVSDVIQALSFAENACGAGLVRKAVGLI